MRIFWAGSVLLAVVLSGCDSTCCQNVALVESAPVKVEGKGVEANLSPIPVISGLQTQATCGTMLSANGTQSSDPDGTIVDYKWKLDGNPIDDTQNGNITLPCDNATHEVCLTVTDDKGASQSTCQKVQVVESKPVQPKGCNIVPKITYEKADSMQYKFYCTESTYDGEKIDADTVAECDWHAKKEFTNGDFEEHNYIGPIKWVNVDPDTFKAMDLTLTVKKGDCEATITKHYFIPDDLPY